MTGQSPEVERRSAAMQSELGPRSELGRFLVHRLAEAELFRRFVEACRADSNEYERAAARREVA